MIAKYAAGRSDGRQGDAGRRSRPSEIYLDYSPRSGGRARPDSPGTLRGAIAVQNVPHAGRLARRQSDEIVRIDATVGICITCWTSGTCGRSIVDRNPVYVRDVVDVTRDYEAPPLYLNYIHAHRDPSGVLAPRRAPSPLAVQMRSGEQIAQFSRSVNAALAQTTRPLPEDLVIARTSDQPRQVEQKIGLFMTSLYEAIIIIIFVGFIGFFDWRSTVVLALSIPATLAMTFIFMSALGIDVQQMSIAALILALGLLVDDPVVAGDAIKHELGSGSRGRLLARPDQARPRHRLCHHHQHRRLSAVPADDAATRPFIYSLPVVMTCTLVASVIVSFTFIPLVAYYLIKAPKHAEPPMAERRSHGFPGLYYKVGDFALRHRWGVFAGDLVVLVVGGYFFSSLKPQFFPKDLSYLSYVDVWLPPDAPLGATNVATERAEKVIRERSVRFGRNITGRTCLRASRPSSEVVARGSGSCGTGTAAGELCTDHCGGHGQALDE